MNEITYAEELAKLREKLDQLDALHDTIGHCGCPEHMRLYEQMDALVENPPCSYCRGAGCCKCNFTGWR